MKTTVKASAYVIKRVPIVNVYWSYNKAFDRWDLVSIDSEREMLWNMNNNK